MNKKEEFESSHNELGRGRILLFFNPHPMNEYIYFFSLLFKEGGREEGKREKISM